MKQEAQTLKLAKWWLCNTTIDLEPGAFSISPNLLPIGPLIASNHNKTEEKTCQECDQIINKTYICYLWNVGIEFEKDENELVSREEIKNKVEMLLEDEEIKERSLKLKEILIKNKVEGDKNLNEFINWVKE
ncbi:hypothetical protein PIB30_008535 [Stylosanthes scabra]|uniref:Uncharacterized protein n=1 Tax=Stylosanthes scabra TaxID=79078 RepID=A0ABU6Z1R5_9FABA|nr:hypothetical protein [Stylosanthes scabra]